MRAAQPASITFSDGCDYGGERNHRSRKRGRCVRNQMYKWPKPTPHWGYVMGISFCAWEFTAINSYIPPPIYYFPISLRIVGSDFTDSLRYIWASPHSGMKPLNFPSKRIESLKQLLLHSQRPRSWDVHGMALTSFALVPNMEKCQTGATSYTKRIRIFFPF